MTTEVSYEAEEYIKAIYKLQKRRGVAKTTELAKELNVVPGSVTNTTQHLKKHGLIKHKPYRGITLTTKGEKTALKILRKHRLAERLLTDILRADWSKVHDNACKLEHALTEDVVKLMDKRLQHPKFCPHGNPIPTENGKVKEKECCPLKEAATGKKYKVAKITDEKREKLKILAKKEITPGSIIYVVKKKPSEIILQTEGKKLSLANDIASHIHVEDLEDKNNA